MLRPFDERLGAWCRARGVVYTRYCDDLAFSGTALDGVEERAEEGLRRLLGQMDFWLQAQPDSQEAAEYRRWLLAEMRDGR